MKRRIRIPIGVSFHYEKDRVPLPFLCIEFPPDKRMPEVKQKVVEDPVTGDADVIETPGPLSKAIETVIEDAVTVVSVVMAPPPPFLLLSWVFWETLPSKALFVRVRARLLQALAPFVTVILEEYDRGEDPFKDEMLQDRAADEAAHEAAMSSDSTGPISPFDEDAMYQRILQWMDIHDRLQASEQQAARIKEWERRFKPSVLEVVSSSDQRVPLGSIFTLKDRLPRTVEDIIAMIEAERTD